MSRFQEARRLAIRLSSRGDTSHLSADLYGEYQSGGYENDHWTSYAEDPGQNKMIGMKMTVGLTMLKMIGGAKMIRGLQLLLNGNHLSRLWKSIQSMTTMRTLPHHQPQPLPVDAIFVAAAGIMQRNVLSISKESPQANPMEEDHGGPLEAKVVMEGKAWARAKARKGRSAMVVAKVKAMAKITMRSTSMTPVTLEQLAMH